MRRLFSPSAGADDAPAPVAARGWDAVPGWGKLAVCAGGVALFSGAVIFLGDQRKPVTTPTVAAQAHTTTTLHEYDALPVTPEAQPASMSNSSPADQSRREPRHHHYVVHPSEIALYTAPQGGAVRQGQAPDGSTPPGSPPPPYDPSRGSNPGAPSALTARVSGATELPTVRVSLVHNAGFSLRPGDHITCASVEAVSSAEPGFVTCRTLEWTRSADQRRGLIPPQSRIFGQIRSGLSQGERRLGVLYTLIETPWFNATVSAPGGDAMGRAGLDGVIETFFWDRAGAVALYALMDTAVGAGQAIGTNALARSFSGGNGTVVDLGGVGGQAQGLASQEMASRINRPPVLNRDQALPVVITVAQDVDFSDACHQAMQVDPMACPVM